MQVITSGGVEIGTLELNEVGQKILGPLVDDNVPLKIAFDMYVQVESPGDRSRVEVPRLTKAAIVPNPG